jgi:hypothetical protein
MPAPVRATMCRDLANTERNADKSELGREDELILNGFVIRLNICVTGFEISREKAIKRLFYFLIQSELSLISK